MTQFVVDGGSSGERLDVVLATELHISRSQAADRIAAGEVTVDGAVVPKRHLLRPGAVVVVEPAADRAAPPAPPMPPIRYRDEHLLIVAKPPGLVVHPGAGHAQDTLVDALRAAGIALAPAGGPERPGIVHRLDRDTSGLLVIACTDIAHQGLVAAMSAREVHRRYLGVVLGQPENARGRIDAPIGRDPSSRTRFGVVTGGKPAVTRYTVLGSGPVPAQAGATVSLLACSLETGRTHQIRVHLRAIGHPIVGDATYGRRPSIAAALHAERPLLHATSLSFRHPVTGERVEVTEPPPEDLRSACRQAGIDVPDLPPEDR